MVNIVLNVKFNICNVKSIVQYILHSRSKTTITSAGTASSKATFGTANLTAWVVAQK